MRNFQVVIQIQLLLLQNRDELKKKGDKVSNLSGKSYYFSLSKGNVPVETFLKEFHQKLLSSSGLWYMRSS